MMKSDVNDPPNTDEVNYRERVFEIVRRIPAGHVMTYGQLAILLGEGYTARTVGYVMSAACSTGRVVLPPDLQQRMLESEGIAFDARGRCELERLRWTPEEYVTDDDKDDSPQPSLFGD